MYKLYKLEENLYQIHSSVFSEKAMEGSLLAILTYCTTVLNFDVNELEVALLEMLKYDHDSADFGINRTFIFSFNKNKKYDKVS